MRDSDSILKFHRTLSIPVLVVSCLPSPPLQQTVLYEVKNSDSLFVLVLVIYKSDDAQAVFIYC